MSQFKDVIFFWPSTHSSIPAGYERETSLDDKFTKAWGDSVAPNQTGGAASHTHTGNAHSHSKSDTHTHTITTNSDSSGSANVGGSSSSDPTAYSNHNHSQGTSNATSGGDASDTITYPADSATNNRPAYHELIYIKGTASAGVPASIIALGNSETVPTGWRECTDGSNGAPALGNKYPRGATTDADAGTTGGSNTHTHVLNHSHSTVHSHTGKTGGPTSTQNILNNGTGSNSAMSHQHDVSWQNATVSTDTYTATLTSGTTEPAYKKLLGIQNVNGGAKKGIIALYLGSTSSLPKGWELCDGTAWSDGLGTTPDMRDKFLKFANAASEIGNTGGANTHEHSASNSHSHTGGSGHTHTTSVGYSGTASHGSGGDDSPKNHTHSVNTTGAASTQMTWAATTMSAQSSSNEPEYRTLAFIQLIKPEAGGGGLMLMSMMT